MISKALTEALPLQWASYARKYQMTLLHCGASNYRNSITSTELKTIQSEKLADIKEEPKTSDAEKASLKRKADPPPLPAQKKYIVATNGPMNAFIIPKPSKK